MNTRLIAFYLPQFHPTPENDLWWGAGFTEWTNVAKARPRFEGHYQPHIPADLGFYDLRLQETQQAQASLAADYGIHGFCYYHYWFSGRRLLSHPLDQLLSSGKPDFPICLCWANEDWTRAWDGQTNTVLIKQEYSDADDSNHIEWLLHVFKDARYIRIDGRPLFLVYNARKLPSAKQTAETWRKACRENGIGEIFLCHVENSGSEHGDPNDIGFDAAVEFQPDWGNLGTPIAEIGDINQRVYDYSQFVELQIAKPEPPYPRFPCVTPSWDNSARRPVGALTLAFPDPATYRGWLFDAISKSRGQAPQQQLVFINAWNEWAEGNHLEPDLRFQHAYLQATKDALLHPASPENSSKTECRPPDQPQSPSRAEKSPLAPQSAALKALAETADRLQRLGANYLQGQRHGAASEGLQQLLIAVGDICDAANRAESQAKRFYNRTSTDDQLLSLDQKLRLQQANLEALQNEVAVLHNSYSWRLTKPLRMALSAFRNLSRRIRQADIKF